MQEKERPERLNEIPFIYETVVAAHRQKQMKRLLRLVACAALFGCVAGACLLFMMRFKPKDPVIMESAAMEQDSRREPKHSPSEDLSPLGGYYQANESFVTVLTVYGTGDWMDDESTVAGNTEIFGVIVAENSEEFYILTAATLLENAEQIYVAIEDVLIDTSVRAVNYADNIAVLSIVKEDIPEDADCRTAVIGSTRNLKQGDNVIAAGSPYAFAGSVNYGHVTYIGREETYDCSREMIYTDMSAAAESHGVLLSENGEIIAWITRSREEGFSDMIAAAAIDELSAMISLLIDGESAAYLGIGGKEITEQITDIHGVPEGFYITMIAEESPAKRAGLQPGDLMISLNGQQIRNSMQLKEQLEQLEIDDSVAVELKRMVQGGYETMTVDVVLGER